MSPCALLKVARVCIVGPPLPFLKLLRWLILPHIANEQDGVKGPIHSVGHPTAPAEGKEKNQYDSKMLIKHRLCI